MDWISLFKDFGREYDLEFNFYPPADINDLILSKNKILFPVELKELLLQTRVIAWTTR